MDAATVAINVSSAFRFIRKAHSRVVLAGVVMIAPVLREVRAESRSSAIPTAARALLLVVLAIVVEMSLKIGGGDERGAAEFGFGADARELRALYDTFDERPSCSASGEATHGRVEMNTQLRVLAGPVTSLLRALAPVPGYMGQL